VQKFENRLRVEKVTESLKVETFLRHSVIWHTGQCTIAVIEVCICKYLKSG